MQSAICEVCPNEFHYDSRRKRKYCSPECAYKASRIRLKSDPDKARNYYKKSNRLYAERTKTDPALLERRREQKRRYAKKWETLNRAKSVIKTQKRRARIRGADGFYTEEQWESLCVQYKNRCLCCGEIKFLTVDHVIPLIHGGKNTIENIQPLCVQCNSSKGVKTIDYRQK